MARAGHHVTLIGRHPHMNAVAEGGLRISGIWGEHRVHGMAALTELSPCVGTDFDLVLLTVKSYDTAEAVRLIAPVVSEHTLIGSYQNGLGNAEIVAEAFGWERVVGVRAIYGAWLPAPGHVEVTVIASPTALGVYVPGAIGERVRAIVEAMNDAGLPTLYTDSIQTLLWGKVAYNCALNPLSALLDVPYGALLETEHTRVIMKSVVHELYDVAGAMQVCMDPSDADDYVVHLFERLIPPTAAHYASMREDFRRRRRTEIEALNGAICRYGEKTGVACPTNQLLTHMVLARQHALGVVDR